MAGDLKLGLSLRADRQRTGREGPAEARDTSDAHEAGGGRGCAEVPCGLTKSCGFPRRV